MKDKELMTCTDWQEMLASMHEDDHSFAEWVALNEHVDTCSTCSAVRTEYQAMRAFIRRRPAPEPPSEFPPRLLQIWAEQDISVYPTRVELLGTDSEAVPSKSLVLHAPQERNLRRKEESNLRNQEELMERHPVQQTTKRVSVVTVFTIISTSISVTAGTVVILSSLGFLPNFYYFFHGVGLSDVVAVIAGLLLFSMFISTTVMLGLKVKDQAHVYKMKQAHRELELERARKQISSTRSKIGPTMSRKWR